MANVLQPIGRSIEHRGITVPTFFYGTAWKEERTETLTTQAIASGFRAIDTASQRRHYYEEGVGKAVQQALAENKLQRSDLFLQSKFTYAASQDHRLPYDPKADCELQLQQSFAGTLQHFNTDYLDSYLLHGPATGHGLIDADWEVWRAMEDLYRSGAVKLLGVSNVDDEQLLALLEGATVKPAFVQNRCFAYTRWDARIREICRANDIRYQGFSLLTANTKEITSIAVQDIAKKHGCGVAQITFRFALQIGMIPLTGTTSQSHMQEDLAVYDIELDEAEIDLIENIAF